MYRLFSLIVIFSFVSIIVYFHNHSDHLSVSRHAEIDKQKVVEIPQVQNEP